MGAVSAGAKGISIEPVAQTAHKERKGGKHSKDFLFRSGIRVLEGSRTVSRKVPSSCLIWGISRAASTVDFIQDYIILKSLPESENAFKGLAFLAQVPLCQHSDKTVRPNRLFSLSVSHKPIFLL